LRTDNFGKDKSRKPTKINKVGKKKGPQASKRKVSGKDFGNRDTIRLTNNI
jgi:hypothetical protein